MPVPADVAGTVDETKESAEDDESTTHCWEPAQQCPRTTRREKYFAEFGDPVPTRTSPAPQLSMEILPLPETGTGH